MADNKEVFTCINDAAREALRNKFGPPGSPGTEQIPAQAAVALMQASLVYFAMTGAPKQVVYEFFMQLMGVEGEKAKLEEKPGGKLVLVPPPRNIIAADTRNAHNKRK